MHLQLKRDPVILVNKFMQSRLVIASLLIGILLFTSYNYVPIDAFGMVKFAAHNKTKLKTTHELEKVNSIVKHLDNKTDKGFSFPFNQFGHFFCSVLPLCKARFVLLP
jgi:D-arabinose 1-dehydrogenase-like Zn-dependent alcohol dehydrogenase